MKRLAQYIKCFLIPGILISAISSGVVAEEPDDQLNIETEAAVISDNQQPLSISAARAEIDEPNGWATYSGDVELKQGSLSILCDTLEIYRSASGIEKVIAKGTPALYSQAVKVKEDGTPQEKLNAQANSITYRLETQTIELLGSARITQGDNLFEGHSILYRIEDRKIIAKSAQKTQPTETSNQRVKIVLPVKDQ